MLLEVKNMAYVALYRKWRPDNFANLVGQEHVSRTLANAIKSGRIGHAYLFSGPRGTGKTSTAKILAKALNCEQGPTTEPCNQCEACRQINDGSSMDVFEIDAASNRGIDEIRDLRETVKYAASGRYKVYIIDEVHMLTKEAFNALLKTLEEPPGNVVFIMATTEPHKVPATIQSRCQRYDFKRITVDDIFGRLKTVAEESGIQAEDEALRMIAVKADGGMRDALSLLDQCIALSEQSLTVDRVQQLLGLVGKEWLDKLVYALQGKNAAEVLGMVNEIIQSGKDLEQVLGELGLHFRSLMIFKAAGVVDGVEYYSQSDDCLKKQASGFSQEQITWIMRRLHEASSEVKWSPQPRIAVEAALLEICQWDGGVTDASPAKQVAASTVDDGRIAQLEAKLAKVMGMLRNVTAPTAAPSGLAPANARPAAGSRRAKPAGVSVNVTEDGRQLWEKTIAELKATGKDNVMACIQNCSFLGMNDVQLVLGTPPGVMGGVIERVYKKTIEDAVFSVSGMNLQVVCQELTAAPEPKEPEADIPEDVPPPTDEDFGVSELDDVAKQRLDTALGVFGDGLVNPDEVRE